MPTRVDFYVLATEETRTRLVYACRVIEKAFLQRLRVVVNLGSPADADGFDTLLWTFGDRSFVPHARVSGEPPADAPLAIAPAAASVAVADAATDAAPGATAGALATGEANAERPVPVALGCGQALPGDLLVNLAAEAPAFYDHYARVAEFVDAEPGRREAGRRRFAFYRERGAAPETHKISA
jgi:DNA polymerase-3 subunit chi